MGTTAMWRTEPGVRVLQGAEARIFREAMASLWLGITLAKEMGEEDETGIPGFDTLSMEQKLAMLVHVGEALFDTAIAPPELTAVNEAAIAAIFVQMQFAIEVEISDQFPPESTPEAGPQPPRPPRPDAPKKPTRKSRMVN